jgi:hypothetical protein
MFKHYQTTRQQLQSCPFESVCDNAFQTCEQKPNLLRATLRRWVNLAQQRLMAMMP